MQAPKRILVALESAAPTSGAVKAALRLARTFGATLSFVHAVPEAAPGTPTYDYVEGLILDAFAELREGAPDVTFASDDVIRFGSPARVILDVAEEVGCNWIVVGATERSSLDRLLLGSTAEQVLRESPHPVWVARPTDHEPKKILCAVDDSPASREALAGAAFFGRNHVADVHLLSVGTTLDATAALARARAAVNLHGLTLASFAREGDPSEQILDVLSGGGYDLLVVGCEGRTGLARLWNPNRVEDLARTAPCSILSLHAQPAA